MKNIKRRVFSLLLLCSFTAVAGEFELPEVIVLDNGLETWSIETQHEALRSSLSFAYTSTSTQYTALVLTTTYSDLAPSAILLDGKPLMVWSSIDSEEADSDIYFTQWKDGGWASPERAHANNSSADMVPELSIDEAGEVTLMWWQNTGTEVVRRTAIYSEGHFESQFASLKSATSGVLSSKISSGFYAGMPKRKPNDPLICIAFGDSITQGLKRNASDHRWGITSPINGAQRGSYTEELKAKLTPDIGVVKIYNQGVMGERSYQGVARINSIMSRHSDANCILIMYGANDLYQGLHPSSTRNNIRTMAERARAASVIPIIATITPNTSGTVSQSTGSYNTQIWAYVASTGTNTKNRISLADQSTVTRVKWSLNHSGDGLHLSDRGDAVMAAEWNRALRANPLVFPDPVIVAPFIFLLLGD